MIKRRLSFEGIFFAAVAIVFVLLSMALARFNFDLHHDGYAFSQSLKLINGKLPFEDVYMQYGPLFHYILAGIIFLEGDVVFASRVLAIFLLTLTALMPSLFDYKQRKIWLFVSGIWLLNCYWFAPYEQYFPQFHPSQISLLLFISCAFLILRLNFDARGINKSILLLSTLTFAALLTKINFGILLFFGASIALWYKSGQMKFVLSYTCYLIVIGGLLALAVGLNSMTTIMASHYNYALSNNVFEGVYNTFWMNERHGHVHRAMVLLYVVPCVIIVLAIPKIIEKKITVWFNIVPSSHHVDDRVFILSTMAFCLWLTIYPTGAFQHIWYGSFLALGVCLIKLRESLSDYAYKFILCTGMVLSTLIFGSNLAQKYTTLTDYVIFDLDYLTKIRLAPEVGRSLEHIQKQIYRMRTDKCAMLNLTPNALFTPSNSAVCSLGDGKAEFIWESEYKAKYSEGFKKFSDQSLLIVSDSLFPSLTRRLEFAETDFNQDHVNGFFVFGSPRALFLTELRGKKNWTKIVKFPEKQNASSKIDIFYGTTLIQIGENIKYALQCAEARNLLADDPTLPLELKKSKKKCELEHKLENTIDFQNAGFLLFHMRTRYGLVPINLYTPEQLLQDGCQIAFDETELTISLDFTIRRQQSQGGCSELHYVNKFNLITLGWSPEVAQVKLN